MTSKAPLAEMEEAIRFLSCTRFAELEALVKRERKRRDAALRDLRVPVGTVLT